MITYNNISILRPNYFRWTEKMLVNVVRIIVASGCANRHFSSVFKWNIYQHQACRTSRGLNGFTEQQLKLKTDQGLCPWVEVCHLCDFLKFALK